MDQATIIDKLNAHMTATGISQNKVASALGISASALSTWLNGTYKGSVDQINERVLEYLETAKARSQDSPAKMPIVETSSFKAVNQFCGLVLRDCELGVLVGNAGFGKTTALKEFVRKHKTSILVEADHGYTARALFLELCDNLGLDTKGSLHDLLSRVVDRLNDSGRLIIIDEAEHLPYRALELIRRVHDKAGVGIVLAGMPRLQKNLSGDPTHYAQLFSRVGAYRKLEGLTDSDIESISSRTLRSVPADSLVAIIKASKRNARVLAKLLRWCAQLMRINNVHLSVDVVEQASELIAVAR